MRRSRLYLLEKLTVVFCIGITDACSEIHNWENKKLQESPGASIKSETADVTLWWRRADCHLAHCQKHTISELGHASCMGTL